MGIFGAAFRAGSASSARSAGSRVSAGLAMLGLFGNKRAGARVRARMGVRDEGKAKEKTK